MIDKRVYAAVYTNQMPSRPKSPLLKIDFHFRANADEVKTWKRQAKRSRISLSAWVRENLNAETRDDRQAKVRSWVIQAFGHAQATSVPQRGLRLLEEAIETFQACGGDAAMAHKLVTYVFERPPGELNQELGGVAVTTLALAAAAGLSADAEELREIARVLAKPVREFSERNAAKNVAGFDVTGGEHG